MTRKSSKSKQLAMFPETTNKAIETDSLEWGGFININLTQQEKDAFGFWFVEHESDMAAYLDTLVMDGFKVSAAWDGKNDCYIVTLTGSGFVANANVRLAMSSRHRSVMDAVALAVYKHYVVANEDWARYILEKPDTKFQFG